MLTSRTQKIEEMRGWESGADEYMAKPWTPGELLVVAARLLKAASKKS
jgi:DNA-binding response OmpR family regulator